MFKFPAYWKRSRQQSRLIISAKSLIETDWCETSAHSTIIFLRQQLVICKISLSRNRCGEKLASDQQETFHNRRNVGRGKACTSEKLNSNVISLAILCILSFFRYFIIFIRYINVGRLIPISYRSFCNTGTRNMYTLMKRNCPSNIFPKLSSAKRRHSTLFFDTEDNREQMPSDT